MIRQIKLRALKLMRLLGANRLVIESPWRTSRLTILCYHGISLADEHCWRPGLYIDPDQFLSRMHLLQKRRCCVLSLHEGLERLTNGSLPKRAVCVTFDDGFYDFYSTARPILREFSFPATVYLTTYYSNHSDRPIFELMLSYALWKRRSATLDLPGILPHPVALRDGGCERAFAAIESHCNARSLSGRERHEVLQKICRQIDFDLTGATGQRLLSLMSGPEVARAADQGFDIQLHTHRHRVFGKRDHFYADLEENRETIRRLTGMTPTHFCYTGNFHRAEIGAWLRAAQIHSAATCNAGLASRTSDRYGLPRVADLASTEEVEFDAWVCGVADLFPKRVYPPAVSQAQLDEFLALTEA
jgi:peptidoglycan/xylan/chitin deacetylase (PgdA/CDA1 family)